MTAHRLPSVAALGILLATQACDTAARPPAGAGGAASSATAGGDAAGAAGGMGGAGAGPSDVYPAFHPVPPKLFDYGGPVVASPKLVPVLFANDDVALDASFESFVSSVGASDYWSGTTAEYGVGPATRPTTVHLADAPTGTIDDSDIQALLTSRLDADDPAFPAPDANTIFILPYPKGVSITQGGATSCEFFGAYHNSVILDAAHQKLAVPYVVIPHCTEPGVSDIDELTGSASHELVEAATDPYPETNPAYGRVDLPNYAWKLSMGGEACDLCAQQPSAFQKPVGFDYRVQRCWSNSRAASLHDPCAPTAAGVPYFNAAPVLPDLVTVYLFGHMVKLNSVHVAVGETKDVEVDLFSDAPTSGPFEVSVENVGPIIGGDGTASDLDLSLDKPSGRNGEKLTLSVHVRKSGTYGFEMFRLRSKLGGQDNLWVGAVTN